MDTDIRFRSDMTVELVDSMGDDHSILHAMMVSTKGAGAFDETEIGGRLNFLMKNRHGTPFEHNAMTFYIEAPIFVFREFHRHRIGWSYNEQSARYTQLPPMFYIPDETRALVQVGKPGAYEFVPGSETQWKTACADIRSSSHRSYEAYEKMLDDDVAKEVARAVLPVNTYSSMFATCNARSLMAFLSLRTKSPASKFPSYPQREIEMVAEQLERYFQDLFPATWEAFHENGRVCP